MRHGVSLGWRGNLMIPNLNGPEFVIYESGGGVEGERESRGPELSCSGSATWPPKSGLHGITRGLKIFSCTVSVPQLALMLLLFDLSELGLAAGDAVDQVQIANMVRSDTITGQSVPYAVKVLFTNP